MLKPLLRGVAGVSLLGWLLTASAISLRAALPAADYLAYNGWKPAGQEIFLLDLNRALAHSLTGRQVQAGPPVWSPDGRYLAFEGRYQGGSSIYFIELFGDDVKLLTRDHAGNQYSPVWFQDSLGLYFRTVPGDTELAYRVNLDGSGLERIDIINYEYLLPRRFDPANPIVSGQQDGVSGIFLARNGRDLQLLATTEVVAQEHPQRSPDHQHIALIGCCAEATEVFLMSGTGGQFRQITRDGLHKSNLSWRP